MPYPGLTRSFAPVLLACLLAAACSGESEQTILDSAKNHLAQKDRKAAAIELKRALSLNDASMEARLMLGKLLLEEGDPVAADLELSKALELGANVFEVAPSQARAMLALGQANKVVGQFGTLALPAADAQADLRTTVAAAHAQLGNIAAAERELDAALRAQPGHAAAQMVRARILSSQGDVDGALALLDQVIAQEPDNEHAGVAKGYLLWLARKDAAGALAAHRQVLAAHPGSVAARAEVVTILFRQGQTAEARREFELLREKAPRHPESVYFEAQFAYVDQQFRRSRELVDVLLKLAPDHIRALELAAAAEYQLGNDGQVAAFLSRALKVNPNLLLSRQILAQSHLRAGQPAKAVEALAPLLSGPSADAESLAMAGGAYLLMGDARRADAAFKDASRLAPDSPRVRTQRALALMAGGRNELALKELESVAAADSGPRADLALISSLIAKQDARGALRAIDALSKKLPDSPMPDQLRGQVLLATRDAAAATRSFQAALSKDARHFPAVAALASLDVVARRFDAAKERVAGYIVAVPNRSQPHLLMADIAEAAGAAPAEVVQHLVAATRADPTDASAWLAQIDRHVQYGDRRGALASAQAAAAALPDQAPIAVALARAQLAADDANQAATSMRQLAARYPDSAEVQLGLAEVELHRRDARAAERALRRALEIDPTLGSARRALAMLAAAENRFDQALELAREMQKQPALRALGHVTEGDVESQRRNWSQAAAAYRRTLDLSATSEAAVKLHQALLAAGKPADAERLATDWEAKRPGDAMFAFYRGDLATRGNDYPAAEAHYRKVLAAQPRNALALNNVAWAMHKQSKAGALELAQQANQIMPNRAPILDTLATIQAANGQVMEAIQTQKAAVAASPADAGLQLGLARYLLQAGQRDQARDQLETLARLGDRFSRQAEVAALLKQL
jgi:putative PEP-CTERM system TPR-repeat lipoprotein